MKFVMILVVVVGILFAVPLVVHGIRYNEPGFWMLVGFVILGVLGLRYFMAKHNRDKAKREGLSALVPAWLLQDTIIGPDSVIETSTGVDWLTAVLVVIGLTVLIGGIYILKARDTRRVFRSPTSNPLDYPPPEQKRPPGRTTP